MRKEYVIKGLTTKEKRKLYGSKEANHIDWYPYALLSSFDIIVNGTREDVTKILTIIGRKQETLDEAFNEVTEKLQQELKPRWIPVDKKPPRNNNEWYQCTVIANGLPMTMELFYKNGKWIDNRRLNMFHLYDIYGYGRTGEKHKLSYQELIQEFD